MLFQTQYISSKTLAHEIPSRHLYGLPEELDGLPDDLVAAKPKIKIKKPKDSYDTMEQRLKNAKKYSAMFQYTMGPSWDTQNAIPKLLGTGTSVLDLDISNGDVSIKHGATPRANATLRSLTGK